LGSKFLSPDTDLSNPAARGKLDAALKEGKLSSRYAEMKKEIENIRRESSSEKESRQKVREAVALAVTQGHGKRSGAVEAITPEQQKALKTPEQQERFQKLQDVFEKQQKGEFKNSAEFNRAVDKALEWHYSKDSSPSEVRLFLAALPPDVRSALLAKGDVDKGIGINGKELPYWGTATPGRNSPILPKPANLTPEQEKEVVSMARAGNQYQIAKSFLDSKGLDPYTRLRLQLTNSDLEHSSPENVSKGWANGGGNRVLTASAINQKKGNSSFSQSLYADSGSSIYGQTGASPKRQLLDDIASGKRTAAQALATAGQLPRGSLDAKSWKELNSGIITQLAQGPGGRVSQAVAIGQTGGGKNNTQGWYLYGGKEGSGWDPKASAALGSRISSTLAKWSDEGPEGTVKIANLTRILLNVQNQANAVNNEDWGGKPIRQVTFKQDPQAKRHVEGRIKTIMEENLPTIEGALSQ
jgi:hypothetical protein